MNGEERRPQTAPHQLPAKVASTSLPPTAVKGTDADQQPSLTGVDRALTNRDDWWHKIALRAIGYLVQSGQPFDAYDLTLLGVPEPDHPGRWGAALRAASTAGLIEPVGFHRSRRPSRAGGVCRVWQGVSAR